MSFFELFGVAQAWASAAEAEHHAPSIHQIWFPLGNFLIFAFIIVHYALPLVRNFLQSRRDEVLATVREAAAKKQQIQSIAASLRADVEREKAKLLSDAQTLAARIKEDARFVADQEVSAARQKMREEMASQAEARARELVQGQLSSADQGRLVGDFIQSIGQVA